MGTRGPRVAAPLRSRNDIDSKGVEMTAKVYFTRDITPENVVRLYRMLGVELPGKVADKVHSG